MNKKVVYDDSESVWKFGQFISKFPDDMLSHSLVFNPLQSKNIKEECEIQTLKKKHREELIHLKAKHAQEIKKNEEIIQFWNEKYLLVKQYLEVICNKT